MTCVTTSLRVGGTVSVLDASSVLVTLAEAQATADYRVAARVKGQPILAWSDNHTTTTFEIQFSARMTGDVFYEVTT